jgi:hypothetical protein
MNRLRDNDLFSRVSPRTASDPPAGLSKPNKQLPLSRQTDKKLSNHTTHEGKIQQQIFVWFCYEMQAGNGGGFENDVRRSLILSLSEAGRSTLSPDGHTFMSSVKSFH